MLKKLALLLPFMLLLGGCVNTGTNNNAQDMSKSQNSSSLSYSTEIYDFGEIPIMGGLVSTTYQVTNEGPTPVVLIKGSTSCMCTTAQIKDTKGNTSDTITMAGHGGSGEIMQVLEVGESTSVTATFDPMAHGPNALGPIQRDVFITTNSSQHPELRFRFKGDVVKESSAKSSSSSTPSITFEKTSYDFGTIKQSGGKVSHDFPFTYTGKEPIEITGVPTSCACTSATVSPTQLQNGDQGVLTIKFNPNLHAEPEGRFFKTATLVTEPIIEDLPDVKIWAEIDLDLGPEAFELQDNHDDTEDHSQAESYTSITPKFLEEMLKNKDFTLIDTHIPKQEHIPGTDAFIPYNEISHAPSLPKDKNAKIVLYCRSGSMSRAAAYQLAEEGYTNIYDLTGGKIAWDDYKQQ